jgi:hypothetical protein
MTKLTSWCTVLLEKLIVCQLVKKILLWNLRVHCHDHKSRHWSVSWARWIQSTTSFPLSLRYIIILPPYLCLGLPNGFFPLGFLATILYTFLISPRNIFVCFFIDMLITSYLLTLSMVWHDSFQATCPFSFTALHLRLFLLLTRVRDMKQFVYCICHSFFQTSSVLFL